MSRQLHQLDASEFFADVVPAMLALDDAATDIGRVEFRVEQPTDPAHPMAVWTVDFDQRRVSNEAGPNKPHVIIKATASDLMALVDGTMSPSAGLLSERLSLAGDVTRIDALLTALRHGREHWDHSRGGAS